MSSDLKKLFCSVKVIDTHAHVVLRETEGAAGKYGPEILLDGCLLYTSPSPRDRTRSRMPSSA